MKKCTNLSKEDRLDNSLAPRLVNSLHREVHRGILIFKRGYPNSCKIWSLGT